MARVSLHELKPGESAVVLKFGNAQERLHELGLTQGSRLTLIRIAPLGDPIEVEFRGARICLRKADLAELEFVRSE